MLAGRKWLRKAAMLLALCAGGVAASAPSLPEAPSWSADPEEQFLLDVHIRLYASRGYIEKHGLPTTIEELSAHRLITQSPASPQVRLSHWRRARPC